MVDIPSLLAMYGGTFDPVHYGHLKPVEVLANLIGLNRVIIIPNNIPLYRTHPIASNVQRKHMLELAIIDNPLFVLDERELCSDLPSCTSKTLQAWHAEIGSKYPLAFIIGQDSLLTCPTWDQYETILDNAHLIVCRRPGYPLAMKDEQHQRWLNAHLTHRMEDLHSLFAGKIYLAETPYFNISGTLIRYRIKNNLSCKDLLPTSVLKYICHQKIYS